MVLCVMGKNTSVSIGDHFIGFIEAQVKEGRYGNASEVVRAGLRLLEEREAGLAALRASLVEGEESGISQRSVADIWAAVKERAEAGRR